MSATGSLVFYRMLYFWHAASCFLYLPALVNVPISTPFLVTNDDKLTRSAAFLISRMNSFSFLSNAESYQRPHCFSFIHATAHIVNLILHECMNELPLLSRCSLLACRLISRLHAFTCSYHMISRQAYIHRSCSIRMGACIYTVYTQKESHIVPVLLWSAVAFPEPLWTETKTWCMSSTTIHKAKRTCVIYITVT